ncbi:MAG: GAF domain-containing protein [Candidatus Omnitrophica bacterium]|nr:GAF domain-containing protein [Candidatus Omnitrophota bacterium]
MIRRESKSKKLKKYLNDIKALYQVSKSMTSTLNLDEVLEMIATKVASALGAKLCTLRLFDEKDRVLKLRATSALNKTLTPLMKDIPVGEGVAGGVALKKRARIVKDLSRCKEFLHPEVARKKGWRSMLSVPMIERDKLVGVLSIYSDKGDAFRADDKDILQLFGNQAAIAIEDTRLALYARTDHLKIMRLFAGMLDAKDNYTEEHSERVMRYTLAIADEIGLSQQQKEILRYASYLHDIGKIGLDNAILTKPDKLTKEEWEEVKKHPEIGADILRKAGLVDGLIPTVLYHHRHYDGRGYPEKGPTGKKISIEARILAVADAYEAMVSKRVYRNALSDEDARAELKRCAGTQFDPEVVDIFLKILARQK